MGAVLSPDTILGGATSPWKAFVCPDACLTPHICSSVSVHCLFTADFWELTSDFQKHLPTAFWSPPHADLLFTFAYKRFFLIDNIITKVGVFYLSLWRFSWPCQQPRECIPPLEKRTSSNAGGSLGIIPVQLERKHIQRECLMKTYALSFQEQRPHMGTWTRQFMHHNYTRQLAYTWKHAL